MLVDQTVGPVELPDAECPRCNDSLCGRFGLTVVCPECGTAIDMAKALLMRWKSSWKRAPGFIELQGPAIWAILFFPHVVLAWFLTDLLPGGAVTSSVMTIVMIASWARSVRGTQSILCNGQGVRLSLLIHLIRAGYLVAIGFFVTALVSLTMSAHDLSYFLGAVIIGPVGVVVIVAGRRSERFVAFECIKDALQRQTASRCHDVSSLRTRVE